MAFADDVKKSAQELAASIPNVVQKTWDQTKQEAADKLRDIWGIAKKKAKDATSSEQKFMFVTPTPTQQPQATPTPSPKPAEKLLKVGFQKLGKDKNGREVFYRQNPHLASGAEIVYEDGSSYQPQAEQPKQTVKVTPAPRGQVLAAEIDTTQPKPTPPAMFQKPRREEGKIGSLIEKYFPDDQWEQVPRVLDGENGGRVENMAVNARTGKRTLISDPAELDSLVQEAHAAGSTMDTGIMQINSKTFADYQRRMGNKMSEMGINSYGDMIDPEKNIKMGALIYKYQGWSAWFGAPKDLRE